MNVLLFALLLFNAQDTETDVVKLGPGVDPPKLISKIEPHYTQAALDAGVQGNVLLSLIVDDHGMPQKITLLSPVGFGLDERAEECVAQWRFKPAMKDGKPVKIRAQTIVNFRLVGTNFDSKLKERRMRFNGIVSTWKRQKDAKPTARDVEMMQDLAKHKFVPAYYMVGMWEIAGDVLPKNTEDGLAQIQKAADKNYGPALFYLGSLKLASDAEKGLVLLRDAAVLGSWQAQFTLGDKYEKGDGVAPDLERAKRYFRLCGASGIPECQFRLAKLLLASGDTNEQEQAVAWLQLADSHDLADAKAVAEAETRKLGPEQVKRVAQLMRQLEHEP